MVLKCNFWYIISYICALCISSKHWNWRLLFAFGSISDMPLFFSTSYSCQTNQPKHNCAVPSHAVMSDSLRPCGLQPTRLLCPWGFSRKECWSGLSCPPPGDLSNPGIESRSPALQGDSLPSERSKARNRISLCLKDMIYLKHTHLCTHMHTHTHILICLLNWDGFWILILKWRKMD